MAPRCGESSGGVCCGCAVLEGQRAVDHGHHVASDANPIALHLGLDPTWSTELDALGDRELRAAGVPIDVRAERTRPNRSPGPRRPAHSGRTLECALA